MVFDKKKWPWDFIAYQCSWGVSSEERTLVLIAIEAQNPTAKIVNKKLLHF